MTGADNTTARDHIRSHHRIWSRKAIFHLCEHGAGQPQLAPLYQIQNEEQISRVVTTPLMAICAARPGGWANIGGPLENSR